MHLDLTKLMVLLIGLGAITQDLLWRRVSNKSIILATIFMLGLMGLSGLSALGAGLVSFALCLTIGFILWQFRVLGAGDVKLIAVLSLSLPWARSLEFLFYSFVWGGLLGIAALIMDKTFFQESRILNFHPMMSIRSNKVKNHKIPFTVGILLGMMTLWVLESKGVYFL